MSGAEADDAGTSTASVCTMPCSTGGNAIDAARSAPSAVMHGMAAVQLLDAGPEDSLFPVDALAAVDGWDAGAATAMTAGVPAMPGMVPIGIGVSPVAAPVIAGIPGTTHTTPPATIGKWIANRARRRPAERRMRMSTGITYCKVVSRVGPASRRHKGTTLALPATSTRQGILVDSRHLSCSARMIGRSRRATAATSSRS
jgi:hypothetical protein